MIRQNSKIYSNVFVRFDESTLLTLLRHWSCCNWWVDDAVVGVVILSELSVGPLGPRFILKWSEDLYASTCGTVFQPCDVGAIADSAVEYDNLV